jgi:hypothetical protein
MKTLCAAGLATLASISSAYATPCKQAMDQAIAKYSPKFQYQTTAITPVGDEQMVEVTAMVYGRNPKADTLSSFYYLVSATCKAPGTAPYSSHLESLELKDDQRGEGGVIVKVVTKQRY